MLWLSIWSCKKIFFIGMSVDLYEEKIKWLMWNISKARYLFSCVLFAGYVFSKNSNEFAKDAILRILRQKVSLKIKTKDCLI